MSYMINNGFDSCLVYSTGVVRLSYETKGRKGKGMTLITGLPVREARLFDLAKKLKQRFGAGGSVKDRVIELQGDHREGAAQELRRMRNWL